MNSNKGPPAPQAAPPAPKPGPGSEARALDSAELFRGCEEVLIRHNGREYRLRHTRFGKLILTA
jgi:hemin uptake protein HemP